MIHKLRRNITLINVVSICIVFFVALIVMFSSGYKRIDYERMGRCGDMLFYDEHGAANVSLLKGTVLAEFDPQTQQVLFVSSSDEVQLTAEQKDKFIRLASDAEEERGWLSLRVLYVKRTVGGVERIVLLDKSCTTSNAYIYVWYSLTVLVVGAACYLVISYFLARVAIKPVEESWRKQKQFVADASHELKTPLSVIMANTEIIASHKDETVASQMKWIENTLSESQRMAGLVNDLLFLAKNDDGVKAQMSPINLSECAEKTVLGHEALFYENGKTFSYRVAPRITVFGNEGQIRQLLTILLDNANKYSAGSGKIDLDVSASGKHAVITASNDCDELTSEQLSHLFDRFYTVDKSRNKNNAGNGLGLSIAQIICKTHRGNISVDYADGRITFTAVLPVYKAKQQ